MSPKTTEVVVWTTRLTRFLAWIGAIPHWFYFGALRVHQELWTRSVVWTATIGCVLALAGVILGFTQFRWKSKSDRRGKWSDLSSRVPYAGLMRWHYVVGVVFGVFTLTWVFSGLLSMEPYRWLHVQGLQLPRDTFTGGMLVVEQFPVIDGRTGEKLANGHEVNELEFLRIQGDHYLSARFSRGEGKLSKMDIMSDPYTTGGAGERRQFLIAADTLERRDQVFSSKSVLSRLMAVLPEAPVVDAEMLRDYDAYYYGRDSQKVLPVLRV